MKLPAFTFEACGPELRRSGQLPTDDTFGDRVEALIRDHDPWCLWVTKSNGDLLVKDLFGAVGEWCQVYAWAVQGLRPVHKTVEVEP